MENKALRAVRHENEEKKVAQKKKSTERARERNEKKGGRIAHWTGLIPGIKAGASSSQLGGKEA